MGSIVGPARGALLAGGIALAVTLLMAWPVVRAPSERLFGSGAVLGRDEPNRDPLSVIAQFQGAAVPSPYLQPLTDLPGRALARLMGGVAAYNVVMLASFPLAAAAAYLLARHLLASHLAAMVAGLAYAFLPFHVTQAGGHPHVAQVQWLPLYFLALCRCVDRPGPARALWLLAAAAVVSLADFYAGFIAAVLSPVLLVAYGGASRRRATVTGLVLAGGAALGVVLIRASAVQPASLAFPRSDLFDWSARWWSYLVPPVEHPLLGEWVRHFWESRGVGASLLEHQQVSLPWSLLVLACIPLWHWGRRRTATLAVRNAPVLASVALAALLCSLSPERMLGPLRFVRPAALLYELAPMFRAYARFGVAVGLMTALLAGAGAAWLWAVRRWMALVLLGLAVLELAPFPPWRSRDVLPTRAHRWLAAQPGPLRILDCAESPRVSDGLALPLLGHAATFLEAAAPADCGEPRLGEKLRARGYTHLLVRRPSPLAAWLDSTPTPDGLARGPEFEDGAILTVAAEPPRAYVGALLGFHPREYEAYGTWRWMGQAGTLRLVTMRDLQWAVLELELRAFPRERSVAWALGGTRSGRLEVAGGWRRYRLPLGPLAAGQTTLSLTCLEPAIVADAVLVNGDPRPLALALAAWRIEGEP